MALLLVRTILWAATLLVLAVAAGADLKRRIVPNETVALVALGGIALAALTRPSSLWIGLPAAFFLLLGCLVFAHFDFFGAGDAKMIAAVSLLVPPERIAGLLMGVALTGGLLSLVYFCARQWLIRRHASRHRARWARLLPSGLRKLRRNERARILTGRSVPYSLAILGTVVVYVAYESYQCSSGTSCLL